MIFPGELDDKYAKMLFEATRLSAHVKKTQKTPAQLITGDLVVITLNDVDKVGTVVGVDTQCVFLKTVSAVEKIKISNNDTIHIIKKAAMKEHNTYERDLHSADQTDGSSTQKVDYHKFPSTTQNDKKVTTEKTSEFPATKKLSLKQHKAYQFVAGDMVYSAKGIPSQIVEIVPGNEMQAAMAVLRSMNGNDAFVDFLTDLAPVRTSKSLSLHKRILSLRNVDVQRVKLSKQLYNKSYDALSRLEQLDIDDHLTKLN